MQVAATARKPQKTVMVVDDNVMIRREVCKRFLANGFTECVEAENGEEALKKACDSHPDLIILDLSMPVMNGIQAAPALKIIVPDAPIILFTLFADQMNTIDLSAFGVSATFLKTESLDKLYRKANELLGN